MNELPYWVQYIQALAPTVVAVIAALFALYIGWRQWRTAHDKLSFDLYEKRLAVYEAIKKLSDIATVHVDPEALHGSRVSTEDLHAFYNAIRGAEFLFDGDARKFLMTIHDMIWEANNALVRLKRSPRHYPGELEPEEEKLVKFLSQQNRALETMFKPYIDLSKVGLTR
jgi:hypothetical protein